MAEDVGWGASLATECAQMPNRDWATLCIDREKAFDRLPWDLMFKLLKAMGAPAGWVRPLENLLPRLRRRIRIGRWIGNPFGNSNSWPQGLGTAIHAMNALMAVWAIRLQNRIPWPW